MAAEDKVEIVSLAEVKSILKKVEKEREELQYEQRIALEHATKFAKLSVTKTNQLRKELEKIGVVTTHISYKIADILPKTDDDVKTLFAKERITLKDSDIKEIITVVNKYYIE